MNHAMFQVTAPIVENVRLARDTFRVRLSAPEIAATIRPGQFVMLRLTTGSDPLLGRPFALYDIVRSGDGHPVAIDVVYLVVGKATRRLSELRPGDRLDVWGPLGNGFRDLSACPDVALVAGGIGQTPFLAYVKELLAAKRQASTCGMASRVRLYYGVRTADLAAGVDDFRAAGAEVHLASDDSSLGFHGYVTELFATHDRPAHIVGCGPEPMLHALAKLARAWNVPCDVSLETPMACGLGVCFSCVTRVTTPDGWDYKRVCVDGPIFDARTVAWDA